MTERDPRPLKSSGETPPELARALRALGRNRDAVRLARVAERLGTNLGAAPAASSFDKLSGAKLGLAGFAIGAGVLGYVLFSPGSAAPANPPAAAPSVQAPANPEPEPEPAPPVEALPPAPPTAASPKRPASRSVRSARTRGDAPAAAAAPAATSAAATSVSTEAARSEAAPAAKPQPAAEPRAEQAAVAAPAKASELGLLQQARKAAADDPSTALRLLQEHEGRFPTGMLTPEREVLAIEVLRKLGRTAEAAERLKQFEARYPRSIYLRRLQRAAPHDL